VWRRYREFLEAPPHQVLEWNDTETRARGWLVINSLRGGAAGGGTHMCKGVTREEVTYLAKVRQLKLAFSGPAIGGGKSGIDFDPSDPQRDDVLRRWYAAVRPLLATHYGTVGDLGVDEPMVDSSLEALHEGLRAPAGPTFGVEGLGLTVSDLVTGYGVANAAERLYEHRGETLEGVRCIVEGFGNLGGAAALFLTRMGARIAGIVDADSGLASPEGLDSTEVEDLLRTREGRTLPPHPLLLTGLEKELAYREDADLFVPAAISGSVDSRRLAQLARHGVRRIVCGADQPFREVHLGDTVTAQAADAEFEVIPDIVASQGAARAFHHLTTHTDVCDAEDIFASVEDSIHEAVDAVMERGGPARSGVMAAALDIALERTA